MKKLLLIPLFLFTQCAMARDYDLVFDFALASGGDTLSTINTEGSSRDYYYDDIRAGSGVSFAFGTNFWLDDYMSLQLMGGYKFDSVSTRYEDATFDRFTIDALAWFELEPLRLGLGGTYEMNPELDTRDFDGELERFDNSAGQLVQADIMLGENFSLGLRYTWIDYKSQVYNDTVNGDNVSLRIAFLF